MGLRICLDRNPDKKEFTYEQRLGNNKGIQSYSYTQSNVIIEVIHKEEWDELKKHSDNGWRLHHRISRMYEDSFLSYCKDKGYTQIFDTDFFLISETVFKEKNSQLPLFNMLNNTVYLERLKKTYTNSDLYSVMINDKELYKYARQNFTKRNLQMLKELFFSKELKGEEEKENEKQRRLSNCNDKGTPIRKRRNSIGFD